MTTTGSGSREASSCNCAAARVETRRDGGQCAGRWLSGTSRPRRSPRMEQHPDPHRPVRSPSAAPTGPDTPSRRRRASRLRENVPVDVSELLRLAAGLVPEDARSDAGLTIEDTWEYLQHDEWEMALGLLTDFPDSPWGTLEFWDLIHQAAQQMGLERDVTWCRWRRLEVLNGVIRANLQLASPDAGGRRTPVPGPGLLRPMWDFGRPHPGALSGRHIAAIWVEYAPELQPGSTGPVRLLPESPAEWRHLKPGDVITMHERRAVAGTATITKITPPLVSPPPT
jgi:hypothetical protein